MGRLWLCGKHFIGPEPEAAIEHTNADVVVCLNEEHELVDRYPDYVDWLKRAGDRAIWFPVHDMHAPPLATMLGLLDRLRYRLEQGDTLLVHCGAGIGRAGTTAAATLLALGSSREEALSVVASSRPMAGPESGPQQALIVELADHFGSQRP